MASSLVTSVRALRIVLGCLCIATLGGCGGGGKTPVPPTLLSISISPQNSTLSAGLTQQCSAIAHYSDGSSNAANVTWSTSNSSLGTINSAGLLTAVKQGVVTISAAAGAIAGSTSVTVGPPNLLSISVSPQSPTISAGQTKQFSAIGTYTDGSSQTVTGVTWHSGMTNSATVDSSGLATAHAAGATMIEASEGTISGSTTLVVTAAPLTLTYIAGSILASGIGHPEGIVVADFNGDGKPDIAVSNFDANTIAVFLNDGLGSFGTPTVTSLQLSNATGLNVGSLAYGDFNEDGRADLVVSTIAGSQVSIVLLGNGDGTFHQQPAIPNSFGFLRARIADLNGDGHQDLVFALDGSLGVSAGNGDGTFSAMTTLPSGSFPGAYFGLTVADFNGDGKLDIAACDIGSAFGGYGTLVMYSGNGDGTFANPSPVTLAIVSFPGSLASGDFNGDGKQDLIIGFPNVALLSLGNGDGTFNLTPSNLESVYSDNFQTSTSNPVAVLAATLTEGGKPAVAVSDFNTGTLEIVENSALGQGPPYPGIFPLSFSPGLTDMAVGDLNGDGALDFVVINHETSVINFALSKYVSSN